MHDDTRTKDLLCSSIEVESSVLMYRVLVQQHSRTADVQKKGTSAWRGSEDAGGCGANNRLAVGCQSC